jgi:hypothetical protein
MLVPSAAAQNGGVPEHWFSREEIRQGDIVRVSIRIPFRAKEGTISFLEREYPGFNTGGLLNVVFGIDMDVEPGDQVLRYDFDNGDAGTLPIRVLEREFGRESLKVNPKYTELDEATLERVTTEKAMLAEVWARTTPERYWKGAFVKPTVGVLGSPFGLRRYFNDEPRSPHSGLDLKAPEGTPIYASNHGIVVVAADLFFTGNTVVIDHGMSLYTIYAHLSKIDVKSGDKVERAQPIGLVGATGRVTGAHLHWAVKLGGARVDPATLPGILL